MPILHRGGKFKGPLSGTFPGIFSSFGKFFTGMGSVRWSASLDRQRSWIWSERQWEQALTPAEAVAFRKAGAFLRSEIRKLLTLRKGKYSKPGKPPKVSGREYYLRKGIAWDYDEGARVLLVGPRFIGWLHKKVYTFPQRTIPATLEFGGRERVGYPDVHIESGQSLPANRVVRIAPRPYVSEAWRRKQSRILDLWSDILGERPPTVTIEGGQI